MTDCTDEKTPLLGYSYLAQTLGGTMAVTAEALVAASCAADAALDQAGRNGENEFSRIEWTPFELQIEGMDCIDCLNKLKRAFTRLRGVRMTSMDYMRALVGAEYNPGGYQMLV